MRLTAKQRGQAGLLLNTPDFFACSVAAKAAQILICFYAQLLRQSANVLGQ